MLQETHSTANEEKIWLTEWGSGGAFSHGLSNSRGVCILFNRGSDFKVTRTIKDDDGRLLIIQMEKNTNSGITPSRNVETLTLVNIYAPTSNEPSKQSDLMAKVYEHLADLEIQMLILGGDLNIQLDAAHPSDSTPPKRPTARDSYLVQIRTLLDEYNLTDIWKAKHPNSKIGTFHRNNYSSRLDYIFAPQYTIPSVSSISIQPEPLSDHCIVSLKLRAPSNTRGPGFWRFDNTLLADARFVQEMKTTIQRVLNNDLDNPNASWEWTKFKIRESCMAYVLKRNRERNAMINTLEKRLQFLLDTHNLTDSSDTVSEVQSIKRELAEIAQERANKTIFKAKAHWTQLGEKPSAYFLGLEKRIAKHNSITALKKDDGQTIINPTDILAYEQEYFSTIYNEDFSQLRPTEELPVSQEEIPQVSPSHKYLINTPFTLRDFHLALKELNTNKSPGSDGITPEFYLTFWELLQHQFYESIMYSMEQGSLSQEQRTGIVTLIPKKDQDRLYLNNWRPITLLNTDFKIFSKALAIRLQSCIQDVVEPDQTGFIRGRTIGTNLTGIQMVIDHIKASSSTGLLLAVDYRKAFDTIRWDLIHQAIQLFGFGNYISTAVKLLFNNIKTCVSNNGFSSPYFYPTRGIRQGCCSSPSIFVITVELLALMVRRSLNIRGIVLAGRQIKISQYADDATFFVRDFTSLDCLLGLLHTFATFSGLHINYHKSYLLLLGNHLHPPTQFQGIRISDQVTILGITFKFEMDENQHYLLNFQGKLTKIKSICSTWSNRNLSMKGKVLIISALLSSILQYPCSTSITPTRLLLEYKKITTDFFWNNKRGKVAYKVLIQDVSDGGIKLPDLSTRVQTTHLYWIKFLWENPDSLMALMLTHYLQFDDIHSLILCKTNLASRLPSHCKFLRALLATWAHLHIREPMDDVEVLKEMLWHNEYIQIQQRTVLWTHWREAGIVHINDLLHEEHPRFSSHTELAEKYGITVSFLELLQIRSAIPLQWKRKICNCTRQQIDPKPTIATMENSDTNVLAKSTKTLYYSLVKASKPAITSQSRWNETFPTDTEQQEEYWSAIYKAPYKVARDTKLQAFQFRIINRFLPCNSFLRNIRIKKEDTCTFCPAPDTIQHFLFYCPIVVAFWKAVITWFEEETQTQLHVSLRAFLFGVPEDIMNSKVINFIILFVKFFIYRQKLFHQGVLDLTHFLHEFRTRLQIEEYLMKIENKQHRFHKWQRIYKALG